MRSVVVILSVTFTGSNKPNFMESYSGPITMIKMLSDDITY